MSKQCSNATAADEKPAAQAALHWADVSLIAKPETKQALFVDGTSLELGDPCQEIHYL